MGRPSPDLPIVFTLRGLKTIVWGVYLCYVHSGPVCWFGETCEMLGVLCSYKHV